MNSWGWVTSRTQWSTPIPRSAWPKRKNVWGGCESKWVRTLGAFPLPVEVIPMARSHVARELVKLGGDPILREGVTTDNGNCILDVFNFSIAEPLATESAINAIVGVVCNGLFAHRPADLLLLGTAGGVQEIRRPESSRDS